MIKAVFRAMFEQNPDRFREALILLHPGETGRIVCVVLLSKLAARIGTLKRPEVAALPQRERAATVGEQTSSIKSFDVLADRFTSAGTELLAQRLAALDAKLHTETEQFVPVFQSGPSRHRFEHMPPHFEVDDFIASWSGPRSRRRAVPTAPRVPHVASYPGGAKRTRQASPDSSCQVSGVFKRCGRPPCDQTASRPRLLNL